MKFIHTSDWHLGQEFYSYDRTEEHVAFLTQLRDIIKEEQPDALVVSGDIYHNATPSNAVMRLFTDYLDALRKSCPTMQIVVIAGNHDSSSRLEVTRTLWGHLGVTMLGKIEKHGNEIDFGRHIISIKNSSNAICGYVVGLPYIAPQAYPLLNEETPREERQSVFLQALANEVKKINVGNLPVVFMVHMAITGSDTTGHDQMQGGMDYMNATDLKVDYDYLALGHIHCPQLINLGETSNRTARYCGSAVPVSFDERYVHSVSVVSIDKHGDKANIRTIPIHNPWPIKTIPDEPVEFETALKILENFPPDEQAYIRLYVKLTDVPPQNALERAAMAAKGKKCRFCCFKWEKQGMETMRKHAFADVDQMKSQSPLEIASIYYENKFGQPLNDELKSMLDEVIREVEQSRQ